MLRSIWMGVLALLVLGMTCGPPTITEGPRVMSSLVGPQQSVQLHLRAKDAASTELLAYVWTQEPALPAGRFSSVTAREPTWEAPAVLQPTLFTLRVAVVDRLGQRTQGEVPVSVQPATRGNTPPVFVQGPAAQPATARAGDTLTLTALAQDAEGDALTYSWRQVDPESPDALEATEDGLGVTWDAPEVDGPTAFIFEVSVSDGHGPPVRQRVTVPVRVPSFSTDIQPLFNALCTQCHGQAAALELGEGLSHANLVGVPAYAGACAKQQHLARVQPGEPDSSVLILRVSGEACGHRMPWDHPSWFDTHPEELVRLRSWIRGGALED